MKKARHGGEVVSADRGRHERGEGASAQIASPAATIAANFAEGGLRVGGRGRVVADDAGSPDAPRRPACAARGPGRDPAVPRDARERRGRDHERKGHREDGERHEGGDGDGDVEGPRAARARRCAPWRRSTIATTAGFTPARSAATSGACAEGEVGPGQRDQDGERGQHEERAGGEAAHGCRASASRCRWRAAAPRGRAAPCSS